MVLELGKLGLELRYVFNILYNAIWPPWYLECLNIALFKLVYAYNMFWSYFLFLDAFDFGYFFM